METHDTLPVRQGRTYEQFVPGMRFRSDGRTIGEGDISLFCGIIGAQSPQFLDQEYGRGTAFGGRVAPGPMGLSIGLASTEPLLAGTLIALLGVDNVRYHSPIHPGDTIHNEIEVVESRPSSRPGRGIIHLRNTIMNQRGERVLSFEHTLMIRGASQ